MAERGNAIQLNELELYKFRDSFQIRTWHQTGIVIISLNPDEAKELKKELEEWLLLRNSQLKQIARP